MKKLLASAAAAALFTSPAFAGALIFEPEPEPVVEVAPAPAPLPIPSWTGPFVGLQVGWGNLDVDAGSDTAIVANDDLLDIPGAEFLGLSVPGADGDDDDVVYGLQAGYDYDFGNGFVLGGEVAYVRPEAEASISSTGTVTALDGLGDPLPGVDPADLDTDMTAEIDHLVRVTARGGYSLGKTLLYVKGGGVWIDGETSTSFSAGDASVSGSSGGDDWGWVAGAGVEHMFTDNISGRLEYLYHEVDDFDDSGLDVELHTVAVGLNYRF